MTALTRTTEEAWAFIERQLAGQTCASLKKQPLTLPTFSHRPTHYGRCELAELLEYLAGAEEMFTLVPVMPTVQPIIWPHDAGHPQCATPETCEYCRASPGHEVEAG